MTLLEANAQFSEDAVIQSSDAIDQSTQLRYAAESIVEHNEAYFSEESPFDGTEVVSVSLKELSLISLLYQIRVATNRANRYMPQPSQQSSQGFGQDRDTPFNKAMASVKKLREEYNARCEAAGIITDPESGMSQVVQSVLTATAPDGNYRTPYLQDPTKISAPTLAAVLDGANAITLNWSQTKDLTFADYNVIYWEGDHTADIFQNWNNDSQVLPKINNAAQILSAITDPRITSARVESLDAGKHTFLLVTRNNSDRYVYSPAVVLEVA